MKTMTTMTSILQSEPPRHPFDRAGLGKPPYKFLGYEHKTFQACPDAPVQVGGSCMYCGQGICNFFHVQSADGKKFHVGPDCIKKVSKAAKDFPSQRELDVAVRDHERALRHAREKKAIAEGRELLARPGVSEKLAALPHPYKWQAEKGLTMADFVDWMLGHAGDSGRIRMFKMVRAEIESNQPVT